METAGITDNLPMSRNRSWGIQVKGKVYRQGELDDTFVYVVSPGYLNAIGMHLVSGRDFRWDDNDKKLGAVIINETVARRLWPGQDPIDRIAVAGGADARVIGVVADVHESSVEGKPGWQMYVSGAAPQYGPEGAQLVVRTKLPPETLATSVMSTSCGKSTPAQPATEFRPIQRLVDHAVSPRRFFVLLVGVFAGLGLILASLGIYGVISYSVTQRTQEIGIRMALGATQGRVQLAVIGKTLLLALIGIATGTVASFAISSLIASLLFGTRATDQATFLSMILLLLLVALLAGYTTGATRLGGIDPMIALYATTENISRCNDQRETNMNLSSHCCNKSKRKPKADGGVRTEKKPQISPAGCARLVEMTNLNCATDGRCTHRMQLAISSATNPVVARPEPNGLRPTH